MSPIIGPRAAEKSHKTADAILSRYSTVLMCQGGIYHAIIFYRNRKLFKMLGWEDFDATNVHVCNYDDSIIMMIVPLW